MPKPLSYLLLSTALAFATDHVARVVPVHPARYDDYYEECVQETCSQEEVAELYSSYSSECIDEGCDSEEMLELVGNQGYGPWNGMLSAFLSYGWVVRAQDFIYQGMPGSVTPDVPAQSAWLYTSCSTQSGLVYQPTSTSQSLPAGISGQVAAVRSGAYTVTELVAADQSNDSFLGPTGFSDPWATCLSGYDVGPPVQVNLSVAGNTCPPSQGNVPAPLSAEAAAATPTQTYPVGWIPWLGDLKSWRCYDPSQIDGVGVLAGMQDNKLAGYLLKSQQSQYLAPGTYIYVYRYSVGGAPLPPSETALIYREANLENPANYIRHSQLGSGQPVFCAGTFKVGPTNFFEGPIQEVSDASGHYKPPGCKCIPGVLEKLQELGIQTDNIKMSYFGGCQ